ncbi:MAG: hypothetical protein RLZZ129_1201 [Verrucomicrobiota bacterium]|jgi:hypothetical protein
MPSALPCLWIADARPDECDLHVAFRAEFQLPAVATVDFNLLGASWFNGWLDGAAFCEGPSRLPKDHPEYQTHSARLAAGRHVLAFVVSHHGVATRMLAALPPFLACRARAGGEEVALTWRCQRLAAYTPQVRRVNPQLGFIEWCDTRLLPVGWQQSDFDATGWSEPGPVEPGIGPQHPLSTANPRAIVHQPALLAEGTLVESFGYERDDIPARFFLRALAAASLPPQGVWRRYDLGRVRLMRPRFTLEVPPGTVVEFAYSESLVQGRVSPWITLSAGDSCNLDHYVARGGPQEFQPLAPRGGRFLEVHVLAAPSAVRWLDESVVERAYYGEADGSLRTGDALLDHIWSIGVETHRACAEDAITDNPTRERGQWAGDVVTVGLDIAAAAFSDLRLCRRSLFHSAQCAREDGLVAGLCPGGAAYLTTYAAQWVSACIHYWELTGDRALLEALWPHAERNLAAFAAKTTAAGIADDLGWGFVDWGYVRNPGPSDMGVNLHYLAALRSMIRWASALGRESSPYEATAATFTALIAGYFNDELAAGAGAWERIGYHRAALGLRLGFFDAARAQAGRAFLREHLLRCFPNRHDAPRLSDPAANNPQLITPYFGHFALPELIEHGDMDFVLDQYRTCWGWALGDGRTTWLEVFDTRWSHCHQWSGCPTWQLSRHLLGLRPRFDRGAMHYDLRLATGSLPAAEGTLPIPGRDEVIAVSWHKDATGLHYRLQSPVPLTLRLEPRLTRGEPTTVAVEKEFTAVWPVAACR